ncbi:hypothetical protein [Deinococcus arcticus]|nr:hypothetical protein [Deinococcus arcticus]
MLPPALAQLLTYHAPLSTLQREQDGAVTLLTPGVNVLALNATYLPADPGPAALRATAQWHAAHELPALVASAAPLAGAQVVATLRVGPWSPQPLPPTGPEAAEVVVEQISRLHLGLWAQALAGSRGTPGWGPPLARQLGARLEGTRGFLPLLAYRQEEAVGALLWQAQGRGGAALLWGAAEPAVAAALLNTAAALGEPLLTAWTPEDFEAPGEAVFFSLLPS